MNPKMITLNSEWSVSITYSEEDKQTIVLFSIIHKKAENQSICTKLDIPLLRWNYLELKSSKIKEAIQRVQNKYIGVDEQFSIGGGLEIRVCSKYDYVQMCMFHRNYIINKIIPIPNGPQLQMPFSVWDLLWDKVTNSLFPTEEAKSRYDSSICMASEDHANQMGFFTCFECNPYSCMDCYMDDLLDVLEADTLTIPWSMVENKQS